VKRLPGILLIAFCTLFAVVATAKLPPPSEEAKAKAEEAKTKTAEAAKLAADQLAKAQDQVAARYIKEQKAKGVVVKPTPIVAAAPASPAPAPAAKK
jgi:hypothetical protein